MSHASPVPALLHTLLHTANAACMGVMPAYGTSEVRSSHRTMPKLKTSAFLSYGFSSMI